LGLHLLANRQADQHREDGSEYNISIFHDLDFSFIVFNFSHFSLENLFPIFDRLYWFAALRKTALEAFMQKWRYRVNNKIETKRHQNVTIARHRHVPVALDTGHINHLTFSNGRDSVPLAKLFSCFADWPSVVSCKK
jgi:hypothetical protein